MNKLVISIGIIYFAVGAIAQFLPANGNFTHLLFIMLGIIEFGIGISLIAYGLNKKSSEKSSEKQREQVH